MKKSLLLAALLLGIAGPSVAGEWSAVTSPAEVYRAPGQVDAWHIAVRIEPVKHRMTVTVNGDDVISGKLAWGGSGAASGMYQGKPLSASCQKFEKWRVCEVLVASEVAANLTF